MLPSVQTILVAIVAGIAAQWFSHLLRLPAIIPLLGFGMLCGPEVLGWMRAPSESIPYALHAIVGLGVAVILFEGGLSLNMRDLRLAPQVVRNLLSLGALVTCVGAMLAAHLIAGLDWSLAALYGALMIVTGPTVIVPLLKRVRVTRRVHTVLLWEGILIDAIGAITAVVMLEVVIEGGGIMRASAGFFGALVVGPIIGAAAGWLLAMWLRYRKSNGSSDEELDSLLALAGALAIYGASEKVFHESGLGAVTCAGLVMANTLRHDVERLRRFKGTLTTLLVSVLFMMLAADFRFATLKPLWPWGFVCIAAVMLLVRPASVFLCARGSQLTWRERTFIGLVGPRGIVAASVASLFALKLSEFARAKYAPESLEFARLTASGETLVAITFSTIMVTVVVNGLLAAPLAWLLKLKVSRPEGLLIVGANELALRVAGIFEARGIPILMVDTNPDLCARAREAGFTVAEGSALDSDFLAEQDMAGLGRLLALTSSSAVNVRAALHVAHQHKLEPAFAVLTKTATDEEREVLRRGGGKIAFSPKLDVGVIGSLLRLNLGHVRSYAVRPDGTLSGLSKPFLVVAVVRGHSLDPYQFGQTLAPGTTLIGIEFERTYDEEAVAQQVPGTQDTSEN
ncbi:MAG: cation:proton antiporter [Planctomycetota bacterium]|nr:cation:proton antiporter [Planctomycetota bacterium]